MADGIRTDLITLSPEQTRQRLDAATRQLTELSITIVDLGGMGALIRSQDTARRELSIRRGAVLQRAGWIV